MRSLARELGIQAPSLYKHFRDKQELEAAVAAAFLADLGAELAGARSLETLAGAYRSHALRHPHLYRLLTDRSVPLLERDEAVAVGPFLAIVGNLALARATWAFAHGMVELELAGRLEPGGELEAAWAAGTAAIRASPGQGPVPAGPRPAPVVVRHGID